MGSEKKGCWRLSILSDGGFCIHASGPGERAPEKFEPFAYSSFKFHGLGGGRRKGCRRLLLSEAALLVYMPAARKASVKRGEGSCVLPSFNYYELGRGWRKKGHRRLSTLSFRQGLSMHVGVAKSKARGLSSVWPFNFH